MNDKEKFAAEYSCQCFLKQGFSLQAKDCKIDKGSLSIVKVMFEKDASLNQIDGLVIPKPGSFDGSYVAVGTWNITFFVAQGKGRSFKRDFTRINSATKNL